MVTSYLFWTTVLNDLRAQIATFDGAEVLMVALSVTRVFVEHVRSPGLCLRLNDGVPELLGLHRLHAFLLLLIPVQSKALSN